MLRAIIIAAVAVTLTIASSAAADIDVVQLSSVEAYFIDGNSGHLSSDNLAGR